MADKADKVEVTTNGILSCTKQDMAKARNEILQTLEQNQAKRQVLWDGDFHSPDDESLRDALRNLRILEPFLSELSSAVDDGLNITLSITDTDGITKVVKFSEPD